MKTITVQIGNNYDRLTQAEWLSYGEMIYKIIQANASRIHFVGGPTNWQPWQNMALIFECEEEKTIVLKEALWIARSAYKQESLAYTEGETEFI